jgi:hypothetical protein
MGALHFHIQWFCNIRKRCCSDAPEWVLVKMSAEGNGVLEHQMKLEFLLVVV